jgi:hypothetical protein
MKPTLAITRFQNLTLARVERSLMTRSLQMFGRFEPIRTLSTLPGHLTRVEPLDLSSSLFPTLDTDSAVRNLRTDGIFRGLNLPPNTLAEVRDWADSTPCYGDQDPKLGFFHPDRNKAEEIAGRKFTVGSYFNTGSCPAVRALAGDAKLLEIARRYIGPNAKLIRTQMWWSWATDVGHAARHEFAQLFHFDLDDYKFMKVFFYLTDVNVDAGPHVFVRRSHKRKPLRHRFPMRRLSDAEVIAHYGAENVLTLEGSAGSAFIEDTFGIHKGLPPRTQNRLLLQLEFAQRYYGHGNDERDPSTFEVVVR